MPEKKKSVTIPRKRGPKRNEATGTDNAQLGMSQRQEHDDRNLTEERYSLLEGILQSTSDG
ncbi:MAG TPA: hypothetical protein VFR47_08775, partial [Anaerolineales bacterium]|nr:hypothetical protein [Anaerolineales bacterium]